MSSSTDRSEAQARYAVTITTEDGSVVLGPYHRQATADQAVATTQKLAALGEGTLPVQAVPLDFAWLRPVRITKVLDDLAPASGKRIEAALKREQAAKKPAKKPAAKKAAKKT